MKRKQFIILVLLLVIGFASVSTTLILNGKVGIGVELDDFDVIFIEALLDGKEDTKATISEDKKTITFSTDKLSNVGDTARLDYKVKNTSTQYDADVTINCTNEASEYVTIESSFDGNSIPLISPINMKAQEVKNGYINAEFIKAYPGDDTSIEISCKIEFTATSREEYAYSLSFNSNGGNKIDDKSVVLNDSYGELEEPTRIGYNFLGWYDEEDNKVDSSTVFDSKGNRNLYAKWEEKVYDLNIVTLKDGESKTNTIGIKYGNKVQVSINEKNYYISKMECSDGYSIEDYNLVIPTYGEQKPSIKNNKGDKNGTCTFTLEQGIFEYDYTGSEQSFSVLRNGNYKLETWGASGANATNTYIGGYGGYSTGVISLEKNDKIYVNVGGKGNTYSYNSLKESTAIGGYNGGGYGHVGISETWPYRYLFSGGGATHIAFKSGLLSSLKNSKNSIIIVSGGGGSGSSQQESTWNAYSHTIGGSGGGYTGSSAILVSRNWTCGIENQQSFSMPGGTQSSCLDFKTCNVTYDSKNTGCDFGQGSYASSSLISTTATWGGGGGWYGGSLGAGGSGYIGNLLLTNKAMYCYNCAESNEEQTKTISTTCSSSTPTTNCSKQGNGYAKITLISID